MNSEIYFLTGTTATGKTTRLIKWCADKINAGGIFTPVINGERVFMNVDSKEIFQMVAEADENGPLSIGKYYFSRKGFKKADDILLSALINKSIIIVDEIGPLELRGEGFDSIFKKIISEIKPGQSLIVVIRENLVNEIAQKYGIAKWKHFEEVTSDW